MTSILRRTTRKASASERRSFERAQRDLAHVSLHWDELLREFENEWIAVYDGSVIAHSAEHADVLRQVREAGVPEGEGLVMFVQGESQTLVL